MKGHEDGFTLIELLIYSLVFSAFALTFVYFLTTFFRVSNYQASSGEVTSQANFIVQTIERQIAGASILTVNDDGKDEIDASLGQPHTKLVMKNHAETTADLNDSKSPITISTSTISASQTNIVMKQGNATTTLNGASVTVTGLTFTKISTPPGKDVVLVNMGLKYQNGPIAERISRQFAFGVGKTSDAVFDIAVSPTTSANGTFDLGTIGSKWRSLFLAQDANIDGKLEWTVTSTTSTLATTSIAMLKQGILSLTYNLAAGTAATTSITTTTVPELSGVQSGNKIFMTPTSTMNNNIIYIGANTKKDFIEIAIKNIGTSTVSGTNDWSYLIMR